MSTTRDLKWTAREKSSFVGLSTVHSNRINGSDESAIHVDSSCGPVTNNVISGNTIIEACAGILVRTAADSNSIGSNTFFNARNTVLTADRRTPPLMAARQANTSSVAKSPDRVRPGPEIKRTPSQTGRLKLLTVCAPL
jgi:nitrous oxidase accessory protein NosD